MDVSYINPFIESASNVFNITLNSPLTRQGLSLKQTDTPLYEVSAVIGLSGKVSGTVVFSISAPVAFGIVKQMLDTDVAEINADVADAVGELSNMIAGGAKVHFSQYNLALGLPKVLVGHNHVLRFPGNVRPICVHFKARWGAVALEVGLDTLAISTENTADQDADLELAASC